MSTATTPNIITRSELLHHVAKLHKGRFATIIYETDADCVRPKGNGLLNNDGSCRIRKRSYVSIRTGLDYNRTVNAHLQQSGKDKVETMSLPWGEWLIPNVVIKHKGNFYLRVYPAKSIDVRYSIDGQSVDKKDIAHYLKPKKDNDVYDLGDDKVIVRTVKFDNVVEINADGQCFKVE